MTAKSKVPQIRFKGFSGEWETKQLGEIGSVAMNKRIFKNQTTEKGDIPFYKIGTFGGTADAFISRQLFEDYKSKYPYPQKGDLLISASGSIGRIVEYKGEDEYFQDSNIVWLKHEDKIENSFLKQFYNIVKWNGLEGSTIQRLYNKNILDTEISFPKDRIEQTKIGDYFQQLDKLIEQKEKKYQKLKQFKKAMLDKMFPKNGADTPEIRFKGFIGKWEEKEINELFIVTRGDVLAATETSSQKSEKMPYPVYSSQTKNNGLLGFYKKYLFENAITWTTDGANAGTVKYREGKFYSTNVNGVLLSNDGYANLAIAEILNNIAWKHVSYVGNPKLMNNVMSKIKIIIPNTIEEQIQISKYIKQLDKQIDLQQKELEKLKNIKKASLAKMFV